ncbi:MAG: hypothetical protein QXG00_04385 [Candidatus Woesearchaeota archaeon]
MLKNKKAILSTQAIIMLITIFIISSLLLFLVLRDIFSSKDKAKRVTDATTSRLGLKALKIYDISVYGKSENNDKIDIFYIRAKKDPSSQDIHLNQISIILQLMDNHSISYKYAEVINCSDNDNISANSEHSLFNINNRLHFGAKYLLNSSNEKNNNNLITRNDIVELCFRSPRQIQNNEKIILTITPSDGKIFTLEKDLPETFQTDRNIIYQEGIIV